MKRLLAHLRSRFFLINLAIIMVVSLIAGHFVVTHNHPGTFIQFVRRPGYFPSVAYSASIALILLLVVYAVSFRLYLKYGGGSLSSTWLSRQLFYGVILVIVLELVLASVLFYIMGKNILDSTYFDKLFNPIVLFIITANLCYLLFFRNYELVKVRYKFIPSEPSSHAAGNQWTEAIPSFWYTEQGDVLQVDVAGNVEVRASTLTVIMKTLDPAVYYRGSRYWIVHRDMIRAVRPHQGNRLKICCKANEHHLVVPRRNTAKFKAWLDQRR